jgi:hypothetical protein
MIDNGRRPTRRRLRVGPVVAGLVMLASAALGCWIAQSPPPVPPLSDDEFVPRVDVPEQPAVTRPPTLVTITITISGADGTPPTAEPEPARLV